MGQAPLASPNIPPSVTGVFGVNFPPLNPQLLCLEFGKIWSDFCHVHAMGVVELLGWQCGEGSGEGGKMGNQGEELGTSIICDPSKLAVLVPARWNQVLCPLLAILGTSDHSSNRLACSLSPSQCPQDLLHHHPPKGPWRPGGLCGAWLSSPHLRGLPMGCPSASCSCLGSLIGGALEIIPKVLGVCGITWGVLVGFRGFRGGLCSPPTPAALGGGGAQQGLRASRSVNKLSLIWISGICKHG